MCDSGQHVLPLITIGDDDLPRLQESTLRQLEELHEPFGVVAVAGRYRTGKSFLLNRLANYPPGMGFGVGSSVQACTRGIWVSMQPTTGASPDGTAYLVIDTEGIDSLDARANQDVQVFSLSLLLCRCFIFNALSAIDDSSLKTLSLVTKVCERVRASSGAGDGALGSYMPKFMWLLRDMSLRLRSRGGKEQTLREYLEESLQDREGCNSDSSLNATRRAIRDNFPNRSLHALPRPCSQEQVLQNLNEFPGKVTSTFQKSFDELQREVMLAMRPDASAQPLHTGSSFVALCRDLVASMHSGSVPVIEDQWSLMRKVQRDSAHKTIAARLESMLANMVLPMGVQAFEKAVQSYREQLMDWFRSNFGSEPAEEEHLQLRAIFDAQEGRWRQQNQDQIASRVTRKLLEGFNWSSGTLEEAVTYIQEKQVEFREHWSQGLDDEEPVMLAFQARAWQQFHHQWPVNIQPKLSTMQHQLRRAEQSITQCKSRLAELEEERDAAMNARDQLALQQAAQVPAAAVELQELRREGESLRKLLEQEQLHAERLQRQLEEQCSTVEAPGEDASLEGTDVHTDTSRFEEELRSKVEHIAQLQEQVVALERQLRSLHEQLLAERRENSVQQQTLQRQQEQVLEGVSRTQREREQRFRQDKAALEEALQRATAEEHRQAAGHVQLQEQVEQQRERLVREQERMQEKLRQSVEVGLIWQNNYHERCQQAEASMCHALGRITALESDLRKEQQEHAASRISHAQEINAIRRADAGECLSLKQERSDLKRRLDSTEEQLRHEKKQCMQIREELDRQKREKEQFELTLDQQRQEKQQLYERMLRMQTVDHASAL